LIKFFRDHQGIAGYIDVSKIFRYYIKISFLDIVNLMNAHLDMIIKNDDLLNAVLDYIKDLVKNKYIFLSGLKD